MMMTAINAFTHPDAPDEERLNVLGHVEEFMHEEGIAGPVVTVLEIFSAYLIACGHLERLADKYESEKEEGAAGAIRDECLPSFATLGAHSYSIKNLISFIIQIGESRCEADHLEYILSQAEK